MEVRALPAGQTTVPADVKVIIKDVNATIRDEEENTKPDFVLEGDEDGETGP